MGILFMKLCFFIIYLHNHHLLLYLAQCTSRAGKLPNRHLKNLTGEFLVTCGLVCVTQ